MTSLASLLAQAVDELAGSRWRIRLGALTGQAPDSVDLRIASGDQMLTHSLAHHRDVGAALSQYFAISLQQAAVVRQVLATVPAAQRADARFLDFACGYGRLLRLLEPLVPRERTWASDIQADAVEFVTRTFGVHGLVSHPDPAGFTPAQHFETIWVASLFSHLPRALFEAWLARLRALLAPGGVLCFSVRDVSQLPTGVVPPNDGLLYVARSENAALDSSIYGTTYATEAYVRSALARVAPGRACVRLPRLLCNEQDLYFVARDPIQDLSALAAIRRGPWGWLDVRRIDAGLLDLQGWAASLDDGAVQWVEIDIDGETLELVPDIARPDVAAAFDDARLVHAGWRHRRTLPTDARGVRVHVDAVDRCGARMLIYSGDVTV